MNKYGGKTIPEIEDETKWLVAQITAGNKLAEDTARGMLVETFRQCSPMVLCWAIKLLVTEKIWEINEQE